MKVVNYILKYIMLIVSIIVSTVIGFGSTFIMIKLIAVDMEPSKPANEELAKYLKDRKAA